MPLVACSRVFDKVTHGPEALREPLGALPLLAEVVAQGENEAAGEGNERTMAAAVGWAGEGRDIRVPTRTSVLSAIQVDPGEKALDPPTLFTGVSQRE